MGNGIDPLTSVIREVFLVQELFLLGLSIMV